MSLNTSEIEPKVNSVEEDKSGIDDDLELKRKKQEEKMVQEKSEAVAFVKNLDGSFSTEIKGNMLGAEIVNGKMIEKMFASIKKPALVTEEERRKGLIDEVQNAANDNELKAAREHTQETLRETSQVIKGYMELYNLFMSMCDGFNTIGANEATRMLRIKPDKENYLQGRFPTEFQKNDLNKYNNRPDRGLDFYFVLSPSNLDKFYDTFKRTRGGASVIKTGWGFQAEVNGVQMAFMTNEGQPIKPDAANNNEEEQKVEEYAA